MWFRCSGGNGTGDGATITVTYSEEFYGVTLTATNGVKTVTKVAPSTGSVDIDVPEGGSWVISATVGGETYSSKPVVVELEYATVIETMPNGSTVLPTDDIQTWLKCAGIRDKTTYTTLADVLGDTETLIALCADSNACDYMARSTNWASGVAADSTAMLIVGKYNYCANALLDDSTWETAIQNSPYSDYVNPDPSAGYIPLVPKMTSDTTPRGTVISLNPQSSYPPFQAFDQNANTYGTVLNVVGNYIGYEFDTPQTIGALFADCNGAGGGKWKVQYKISGTWEDIENLDIPSNSQIFTSLPQTTQVEGVRLVITEKFSTYTGNGFNRLQFYRESDLPIIHSAVEDNIFYMDDGSPVALCGIPVGDTIDVDMESFKGQTLTLVSTVAKDPTNLSNDFSMNVRITPNITEIYLMPVGALYWYGSHTNNYTKILSTNGWTDSGNYAFVQGTENKDNFYASASTNQLCGITCVNPVEFTKAHFVLKTTQLNSGGYGMSYRVNSVKHSRTGTGYTEGYVSTTNTVTHTELTFSAGSGYPFVMAIPTTNGYIYALWYE